MDDISAIDAHAAGAWPATETVREGGWLLRHTPGLDRARNNSALPLEPGGDLQVVQRFYADRGAPAIVQVSPLDRLAELDADLAARGWTTHWGAEVLVASSSDVAPPDAPIAVLTSANDRWLRAWAKCEERDDVHEHAGTVFSLLDGRAAYALAPRDRGVGLAVASLGYCAIFCMAVDPQARGLGIGSSVLRALADWARSRGATTIYLQVHSANEPAIALYAKHGFERRYGYHFRRAPDQP